MGAPGLAAEISCAGKQPLEERITALARIEEAAGLGVNRRRGSPKFRQLDRWLISERLLIAEFRRRHITRRKLEELPHLASESAWRLLRTRFSGAPMICPVAADALLFHSNLRSFYLSATPMTVKLLGGLRSASEFRQDVQVRRMILDSGVLNVPRILGGDLFASQPYVMDELVFGRRAKSKIHGHLIVDELLPRLWRMYQEFEMAPESCTKYFDMDAIAERLMALRLPPGWRRELDCRAALVNHLRALGPRRNEAILTGFGHGDLSVGNLIVSPAGDLYVIDWELARRMPIGWDACKLFSRIPEMWHRIFALIAAEVAARNWRHVMQPQHQCLVAFAAYLADWDFGSPAKAVEPELSAPRLAKVQRGLRIVGRFLQEGAFHP